MTQSQTDRIIAKIRKLLALADAERNDNDNERETAIRQANALMDKHGVVMADMAGGGDDDPNGERGKSESATGTAVWKGALINALAALYGCKCYRSTGKDGKTFVIGRKVHRTVTLSMAEYLMRSIDREARQHKGQGRAFLNAFRKGAAFGVKQQVHRIIRDRRWAESIGTGLVLADYYQQETLANERYLRADGVTLASGGRSRVDAEGYHAGKDYGSRVSMSGQIHGRAGNAMRQLGNS